MLKATVNGLKNLRRPEDVARIRGLTISQVLPVAAASRAAEPVAEPSAAPEPATDESATEQTSQ
jgi:hypothetical protein